MWTREQRAAMSAMWLAHWRGWQGSGVSMAEYARREGLSRTTDGRLRYALKSPYRDGTTHVMFEPLDLLARLWCRALG